MAQEPLMSRRFLKAMFFVNVVTATVVIALLAWAVYATGQRTAIEAERTREVVTVLRMEGARERNVIIRHIREIERGIEKARITSAKRLEGLITALAEHVGIEPPPPDERETSGQGGGGGGGKAPGREPNEPRPPRQTPSPRPSPTCVLPGVCLPRS